MDIVYPDSKRCCCFTKSYYRYVKGTGSLLATLQPNNEDKASSLKEQCLRYFTPREVANLHSLPEDFQFPQQISLRQRYALLGNSNGHTYSVKYDWSPGKDSQAVVERVPRRKDIRPCPPPVQSAEILAVGDVAEVFNVGFWKMAKVLKVLDENYYLTRLLGSSEEFRVHKHRIRVRQLWKDDKWVVIGRGSDNRISSQVPQLNARIKLTAGNDCLPPQDIISYQDSHTVSSRSLKRGSPYCSFYIDGYSRKKRAIEKGCEHQHIFSGSPSSFLKKVDAVAYPRENLGEKYMQASLTNRTTGCFEKEREELNGAISCSVERSLELDDCDSDACSVDSFCGDAQENFSVPLEEDVPAGIHRLELNAYRSTLVAMHASGSLTWEQEALLTNLRISLHISNDEHLIEGQGWSLACLALLPKA
ncbi:uncharacterized protein Pyn_24673 [Prunus yedoensis var. nudiflora]|uniref:ENT domain-containing protein n=1 Tax=Prunus yedoensis var. nudiflora TaxID=2094558 RepID=A0A314Y5Y7_PRUYE|nr:uncharacterized protein Pyn_24673 [Prunus yedoensis var. nudiflora]